MQEQKLEACLVIGITVRTENNNGKAAMDVGQLWQRFMTEGVQRQIPNKTDGDILCLYTNFEGDHTQPYDTILGCRVSSLGNIPDGMVGTQIQASSYATFTCEGDIRDGSLVGKTWGNIWSQELNRSFTTDIEVYDARAMDPANAIVDIHVAIHN